MTTNQGRSQRITFAVSGSRMPTSAVPELTPSVGNTTIVDQTGESREIDIHYFRLVDRLRQGYEKNTGIGPGPVLRGDLPSVCPRIFLIGRTYTLGCLQHASH